MKKILSLLFLFSSFVAIYGQEQDTTRYIKDGTIGPEKIIIGIPAASGSNANLNKLPLNPGDPSKLTPPLTNNIPKSNKSPISFVPQETPKDVYVPKFWDGKDNSNTKIETTQYLGKLEVNTKTVRIECRDFAYVDGDRVRVYINGKMHKSNVLLDGHFFIIEIPLQPGFNQVDIQAMNQGVSGPNTAQFIVYDGNGALISTKKWNLLTGQAASLAVLRKSN